MTELDIKVHGKQYFVEQQPAHFLRSAIDDFLVSAQPDVLFSSLIKLSIALEIYLKRFLEEIDPKLIRANVSFGDWGNLKKSVSSDPLSKKRQKILSHFTNANQMKGGKTIDFSIVIDVFTHFYRVPKSIIKDLNDLRDYRNGLFHWQAVRDSAFHLSKQALRLIEWILKFISRKYEWQLGGDLDVIDTFGDRREKLRKLRERIRSENALNIQRRIFLHSRQFSIYSEIRLRLDNGVTHPDAKIWVEKCPACGYSPMKLLEGGSKRDGKWENRHVIAHCEICYFSFSEEEFEAIKKEGFPTLKQIFSLLP